MFQRKWKMRIAQDEGSIALRNLVRTPQCAAYPPYRSPPLAYC